MCAQNPANFNVTYSNLSSKNFGSNPGTSYPNWWYFDTTLQELDGLIGITVENRQKCYNASDGNNWCGSVKTDISTKFVTNYISPGNSIIWNNNWVAFLSGFDYTTIETFNGTDDNGNFVSKSYSFTYGTAN